MRLNVTDLHIQIFKLAAKSISIKQYQSNYQIAVLTHIQCMRQRLPMISTERF